MSACTRIIVKVLKTYEDTIDIYAETRLEAEAEARTRNGVVAVLESYYPEEESENHNRT